MKRSSKDSLSIFTTPYFGRHDCVLCKQQDDPIQNCKKRSVLYENRCIVCNVDVIQRRGLEILNSKSEFSRCRVPRPVINLEEWRSKSKEKDAVVKTSIDAKVVTESDAEDEALIKALEDTEKTIRRKEGKRKEAGACDGEEV